ncbi:uncharacterized protein LOC143223884 [Tachypleus tridentatus]|uniref:uncharacterized protein LOC143223884 n=1 Tax=Tachypleus tridentatus TaxID=6853 RepID=UPI003FD1B11B
MKVIKKWIILNFSIFCFTILFVESTELFFKQNKWNEDYDNNTSISSLPKQANSYINNTSISSLPKQANSYINNTSISSLPKQANSYINNTSISSLPKQANSYITSKLKQNNESLKKKILIEENYVENQLSPTNPQEEEISYRTKNITSLNNNSNKYISNENNSSQRLLFFESTYAFQENKKPFNLKFSKRTPSFLKFPHKKGRHRRYLRRHERARRYETPMFTNTFAMKLSGGETVAKKIAQNCELELVRRIFDDYFLFKHNSVCRRCKRAATRHLKKWTHDSRIEWIEQQQLLIREKRQLDQNLPEIIYDKAVELPQVEIVDSSFYYRMSEQKTAVLDEDDMNFNDPFYHDQWYLHNRGQIGYPTENDMNILPVWKAGYTGSGIHLAVLDDGVHPENPEIAKNYAKQDLEKEGHKYMREKDKQMKKKERVREQTEKDERMKKRRNWK